MDFLDMDLDLILAFLPDVMVIGLSIGLVYGLVALGISLIYSGLDIVHFAHGEIFMFGSFFGLVLYDRLGVSYPITLFLAMILTGIMGVVIERVFYRRLTSQGGGYTVAGMGMIICGFGMAIILQNIAFLIWGAEGHTMNVQFSTPIQIGGILLPRSYLWILIVSVTLMALLHFFLKRTKLGLAVRAVAANKDIAYLMGINVPLMISVIFGVACGLTVIVVEHILKVVMDTCDRVTVLDHGVKISEGTPQFVRDDHTVIEAYLGKEMGDDEVRQAMAATSA